MDDKLLIRTENGSIDVEATVSKFRTDLVDYVESDGNKFLRISNVVNHILANSTESIPFSLLVGLAMVKLAPSPSDYLEVHKLVFGFIRDNTRKSQEMPRPDYNRFENIMIMPRYRM